jgi:hypothetical protein
LAAEQAAAGIENPESFLRVATRPKWIFALLASLAMAAIFALLGQWQLDRSFRTVGQTTQQQQTYTPIDELAKPGEGFRETSDGRLVTIECAPSRMNPLIVANRFQNGEGGFWLLTYCTTPEGVIAVTADAWFATEAEAKAGRVALQETLWATVLEYKTYKGWLLAPEAPEPAREGEFLFESLSLAQLVNVFRNDAPSTVYPGIVALEVVPDAEITGGEAIEIGSTEQFVELNFLNVFYAIEWVVFAGFAVFMWWRLVQDERLGLRKGEGKLDQ